MVMATMKSRWKDVLGVTDHSPWQPWWNFEKPHKRNCTSRGGKKEEVEEMGISSASANRTDTDAGCTHR